LSILPGLKWSFSGAILLIAFENVLLFSSRSFLPLGIRFCASGLLFVGIAFMGISEAAFLCSPRGLAGKFLEFCSGVLGRRSGVLVPSRLFEILMMFWHASIVRLINLLLKDLSDPLFGISPKNYAARRKDFRRARSTDLDRVKSRPL
jgi:hypothetical protein